MAAVSYAFLWVVGLERLPHGRSAPAKGRREEAPPLGDGLGACLQASKRREGLGLCRTHASSTLCQRARCGRLWRSFVLTPLCASAHSIFERTRWLTSPEFSRSYCMFNLAMPYGRNPYDATVRALFGSEFASLFGWPSRGGVIVLNEAEAIDFEFMGLDPLNPQKTRHEDQDAEDIFCQRLLLLGAKWWDSEERWSHVTDLHARAEGYASTIGHTDGSFMNVSRPAPTIREKRWVKVGWPSTGGGFWVSEFDTTWAGVDEDWNLPPDEAFARVKMARTMDERCQILRELFQGKFYSDLGKYEGYAFLRAWEWKFTGEVGRDLLTPEETYQEWRKS